MSETMHALVERARAYKPYNHLNDGKLVASLLDLIAQQAARLEEVTRERDEARKIVRDIYWMALRYADGRQTYAPGMCNDALRKAYDGGWLVHRHQSDPAFARDGASPEYRAIEAALTAAEAEVGRLRGRYEDWKPISEPPHDVHIGRGSLFEFYRDEDEGTFWTGTWSNRRDADIWCLITTPSLNDRARTCLSSKKEG